MLLSCYEFLNFCLLQLSVLLDCSCVDKHGGVESTKEEVASVIPNRVEFPPLRTTHDINYMYVHSMHLK